MYHFAAGEPVAKRLKTDQMSSIDNLQGNSDGVIVEFELKTKTTWYIDRCMYYLILLYSYSLS